MATAAEELRPARSGPNDVTQRTRPSEWVLRAVVSVHMVAICGQPVFAGVYLSGDYDGLRWHLAGANAVTSLGYLQLIVAITVWVRMRQVWPFLTTLGLVVAETVQYVAGTSGALWLHLPLGVMTVAALVVQFIAVWRRPLPRRPRTPQESVRAEPERTGAERA
ncbi:hypothetical protein [Streptomyces sp. NPDC023838]|uniref:hypothetical protein n=1 Tax=Streptomyces sp. NPDC023838 TaxID=3154325 RepID=UPI003406EF90